MSNEPAFPGTEANGLNSGCSGMTLRDYFAAADLQGILANTENISPHWCAIRCYAFADAMLEESEK